MKISEVIKTSLGCIAFIIRRIHSDDMKYSTVGKEVLKHLEDAKLAIQRAIDACEPSVCDADMDYEITDDLNDFSRRLQEHDWYYTFTDSVTTYRRGNKVMTELKLEALADPRKLEMFNVKYAEVYERLN